MYVCEYVQKTVVDGADAEKFNGCEMGSRVYARSASNDYDFS